MSIIKLVSDDDESFEIPESFIAGSQAIRYHLRDGAIRTIYKPATLKMLVDYCTKHAAATENSSGGDDSDDLKEFDAELVKSVKADHEAHLNIIFAASYFNIQGLFVLTCSALAEMRGRTYDEIHMNFIRDDLDYEEPGFTYFQREAAARLRLEKEEAAARLRLEKEGHSSTEEEALEKDRSSSEEERTLKEEDQDEDPLTKRMRRS